MDAAADADEAMRLADDIGASNARALPVTALAWLAGLRGDEGECRRLADEVLALSLERGLASAGLATWALASSTSPPGAGTRRCCGSRPSSRSARASGTRSCPCCAPWDRLEAAVHAAVPTWRSRRSTLRPVGAGGGGAVGRARAGRLPALAAAPDAADAHFEAAIQSIDRAGTLDSARIHLHYGEYLRRERRRIDARVHLRAAFDGFEWLGAAPWAERALRELRATGEKARKRHLSPLAEAHPAGASGGSARGRRRDQQGRRVQLSVSPEKVEYHLRKVFAKPGPPRGSARRAGARGDRRAPA